MKTERIVGKTPSGGDYSEIFYLDKDYNLVEPHEATHCIIRECKADGTLLKEIRGIMNKPKD